MEPSGAPPIPDGPVGVGGIYDGGKDSQSGEELGSDSFWNSLSELSIAGLNIFDFLDTLTSKFMLPLTGLGAILFVAWPYLGKLGNRLKGVRERLPSRIDGILSRVLDAMSLLRAGPMMVLKLLLMAMLGHTFATLAVWVIGYGIGGVQAVTFQEYLLATQLSNLVGAVPLTPGGLGGREKRAQGVSDVGFAQPVLCVRRQRAGLSAYI